MLKQKVIARINKEYELFIEELKKLPAEAVIEKAYEINCKLMFKTVLEIYNFGEYTYIDMLDYACILDGMYKKWLKYDWSEAEEVVNFIEATYLFK